MFRKVLTVTLITIMLCITLTYGETSLGTPQDVISAFDEAFGMASEKMTSDKAFELFKGRLTEGGLLVETDLLGNNLLHAVIFPEKENAAYGYTTELSDENLAMVFSLLPQYASGYGLSKLDLVTWLGNEWSVISSIKVDKPFAFANTIFEETSTEGLVARAKEKLLPESLTEEDMLVLSRKIQPLKRGSKGSAVTALQETLNNLGYSVGKADGDFGGKTESAISSFQRDNGLPETGKADVRTQLLLNSIS